MTNDTSLEITKSYFLKVFELEAVAGRSEDQPACVLQDRLTAAAGCARACGETEAQPHEETLLTLQH